MMSMNNKKEEGSRGAPIPDRWYNLTLGSSFKDHRPSSKFCTLRYEFKPASVDKTQPGTLHKSKDSKISVEFHNNQHGKPNVTFEGSSEDYKENDAVLFFDGQSFRLERLHRAFKRLRHVRLPGESSSSAVLPSSSTAADTGSPPLARGTKAQPPPPPPSQSQGFNSRNSFTAPPPPPPLRGPVSVEVERIDIGDGGNSGGKSKLEKSINTPPQQSNAMASPDSKDFDLEEHLDIMIDENDALGPSKDIAGEKAANTGIDINMPQQNDTDDEIADVDVNDDNGVNGSTAAAALRAQVNAVERREPTSSSSTSSGSESSGSSSESGSGSSRSSSDSESSDGDSVNSI